MILVAHRLVQNAMSSTHKGLCRSSPVVHTAAEHREVKRSQRGSRRISSEAGNKPGSHASTMSTAAYCRPAAAYAPLYSGSNRSMCEKVLSLAASAASFAE